MKHGVYLAPFAINLKPLTNTFIQHSNGAPKELHFLKIFLPLAEPVHHPDMIPNFTKTPHIIIMIVRMKKKVRSVFLLK
jgi:hypothetical protein